MKKWEDGKMKIYAEVHRVSDESTQLMLRPEIYGFSSTFLDDSSISGEWRLCQSNGKFEFEVFNEIATRLQKKSMSGKLWRIRYETYSGSVRDCSNHCGRRNQ